MGMRDLLNTDLYQGQTINYNCPDKIVIDDSCDKIFKFKCNDLSDPDLITSRLDEFINPASHSDPIPNIFNCYYLSSNGIRRVLDWDFEIDNPVKSTLFKKNDQIEVFLSQRFGEEFKEYSNNSNNFFTVNSKTIKYSQINTDSFEYSEDVLKFILSNPCDYSIIKGEYLYCFVPVYLISGVYLIRDELRIMQDNLLSGIYTVVGFQGHEDKIFGFKFSLKDRYICKKCKIILYRKRNYSNPLIKIFLCRSKLKNLKFTCRSIRDVYSREIELIERVDGFKKWY